MECNPGAIRWTDSMNWTPNYHTGRKAILWLFKTVIHVNDVWSNWLNNQYIQINWIPVEIWVLNIIPFSGLRLSPPVLFWVPRENPAIEIKVCSQVIYLFKFHMLFSVSRVQRNDVMCSNSSICPIDQFEIWSRSELIIFNIYRLSNYTNYINQVFIGRLK